MYWECPEVVRGVPGCQRNAATVPIVGDTKPGMSRRGWRRSEGEARDQPEGRRAAGERSTQA